MKRSMGMVGFWLFCHLQAGLAQEVSKPAETVKELAEPGILARSLEAGPVVFLVLLMLVALSVFSWAITAAKLVHLNRIKKSDTGFIRSFWDSRSLNDLNGRLMDHSACPSREMFRTGYGELVRVAQLKDGTGRSSTVIRSAMENMSRSLQKARSGERRKLESYLTFLALTASASPFIGLFGTVWGIMNSFESIARTGTSSLAAVAPGISEALIATAFGLAAAIPAVIGYNLSQQRIRVLMGELDEFSSDFLNIVERYLVGERPKAPASQVGDIQTPEI